MFIGDDQRRKAMTPTLTPPAGSVAGTAADERCDRCNAAGKLRLTLAGGGELVFCGHHANRYAEDLVKIAVQYAADPEFSWRGADRMSNSN
jgi:hypothetical protein